MCIKPEQLCLSFTTSPSLCRKSITAILIELQRLSYYSPLTQFNPNPRCFLLSAADTCLITEKKKKGLALDLHYSGEKTLRQSEIVKKK